MDLIEDNGQFLNCPVSTNNGNGFTISHQFLLSIVNKLWQIDKFAAHAVDITSKKLHSLSYIMEWFVVTCNFGGLFIAQSILTRTIYYFSSLQIAFCFKRWFREISVVQSLNSGNPELWFTMAGVLPSFQRTVRMPRKSMSSWGVTNDPRSSWSFFSLGNNV